MAEHNLDDFQVNTAALTIDRDVLDRVSTVRPLSHASPLRAVVASLLFAQAAAAVKHGQKREWSQPAGGKTHVSENWPERNFERCAQFSSHVAPAASFKVVLFAAISNRRRATARTLARARAERATVRTRAKLQRP